jgi:hypothetical protein
VYCTLILTLAGMNERTPEGRTKKDVIVEDDIRVML